MKANLGDVDRTIRMTVGYVIIIAAAISAHWTWGILGAMLMVSATFKWCPLYVPFRYSTVDK